MLTKNQFAALFVLTLIPFLVYQLRPDIIGYDGYHFLAVSGGIVPPIKGDMPIIPILYALQGNIIAVKVALFLLCFSSVLIFAFIGQAYSEKHGWKAGVLVWLAATFIFEFAKFENDQFAYPLIFLGIYFFIKSYKENNLIPQVYGLACLGIASVVWGGAIFTMLALGLSPLAYLFQLVALPVILFLWHPVLDNIIGWGVMENTPLYGIALLGISLVGVLGWRKHKELMFPGAALLALAIINAKFALLAVPFLVAGIVALWDKYPVIATSLFRLGIIFGLIAGFSLLLQPPLQYEHQAIDYAIANSDGNIFNDWQLGYMVEWQGGHPSHKGFPKNPKAEEWCHFSTYNTICITQVDNNYCTGDMNYGNLHIYRC